MSSSSAHPKKLSLSMAISIGVKAIIGAGLFTAPSALQMTAGPAGILTYIIASIAAMCMALAIARVTKLYPEKGAFYSYAKEWGGPTWGVIAVLSYIIGLIIALGLLALVAGMYMHPYLPTLHPATLGIALITLIVFAHLAGAQIAKTGQKILLILTYLSIILVTLLCFLKADMSNLVPFFPNGWKSIFTAIPVVIFGFFGFEAIPSLFDDIEHPQKNVPLAIIWTMLLVGFTYIIFTGSIFIGLPREFFVNTQTPLSTVLLRIYPNFTWLVTLIGWSIIIAIVGVLHAMIWSLSALVVDTGNLILHKTKSISRKNALIGIGIFSALSCLLFKNKIDLMFSLVALSVVFAYATAIAVLLLRSKGRSAYQIIIALLGLATAALIFGCALMRVFAAY